MSHNIWDLTSLGVIAFVGTQKEHSAGWAHERVYHFPNTHMKLSLITGIEVVRAVHLSTTVWSAVVRSSCCGRFIAVWSRCHPCSVCQSVGGCDRSPCCPVWSPCCGCSGNSSCSCSSGSPGCCSWASGCAWWCSFSKPLRDIIVMR